MRSTTREVEEYSRETGTILVVTMLVLLLTAGLTTALFVVGFVDTRQSAFYIDRGDLREYAENGVSLALMELNQGNGGGDGNVGTQLWTVAGDFGRDGRPSTKDEGEGDGIPTPGEPNLSPACVGLTHQWINLLVRAEDTVWRGTKRIVSLASNEQSAVALETYVRMETVIHGMGATYVPGDAQLAFAGSSFRVNGYDTNPDGTAGPEPANYALTTPMAAVPGANETALKAAVAASSSGSQLLGAEGPPSINEVQPIDIDAWFNRFKAAPGRQTLPPGTYSVGDLGADQLGNAAKDDYRITYVSGDLKLSMGNGAGVLIVDGDLEVSGQGLFIGLVIVRGNIAFKGGGSGIHVYGSVLATNPDARTDFVLSGQADLVYSSDAINKISSLLRPNYTARYWKQLK